MLKGQMKEMKKGQKIRHSSGSAENSDSAYHVAWPKQKTKKGRDESCDDSWDSSEGQNKLALSLMENVNAVMFCPSISCCLVGV